MLFRGLQYSHTLLTGADGSMENNGHVLEMCFTCWELFASDLHNIHWVVVTLQHHRPLISQVWIVRACFCCIPESCSTYCFNAAHAEVQQVAQADQYSMLLLTDLFRTLLLSNAESWHRSSYPSSPNLSLPLCSLPLQPHLLSTSISQDAGLIFKCKPARCLTLMSAKSLFAWAGSSQV